MRQLTLGVQLKDEATFENYFPGKNIELITALKNTVSGSGERVIYFSGAKGEGCTHLLQACCHYANYPVVYLPLAELIMHSPRVFDDLESLQLVCIDDLQQLAGRSQWEEAFFHVYNRLQDNGGRLIVTANVPPKALGLVLPDVVSRLTWGIVFTLQSLSDEEKLAALMMRAERRGMILSEEVGKFILTHVPRQMSMLLATLDTLDKASLTAQRRLTIPFVKNVLEDLA